MTGGSARNETKTLPISKGMVYEAYKKVKHKGGSSGVDGMSLKDLEADLGKELYKLWNRLSSGSYFPPGVKRVSIAKPGGGERPLGIPTVLDRIGQMVLRDYMEPHLDHHFVSSSYGYRKGRNAHHALSSCRDNCRKYTWVIDLDIKGFFNNLDHVLLRKAVEHHFAEKWVWMYVERWLKADIVHKSGEVEHPKAGTPQGGVISPLLSNLYLHYCFDKWFSRLYDLPFERYADDIIIHCRTMEEAELVLKQVRERMRECSLELHAEKTSMVYCGHGVNKTKSKAVKRKFTFLGYDFQPMRLYSRQRGQGFSCFGAKESTKAKRKMIGHFREIIKRSKSTKMEDWSGYLNRKLSGWLHYYSHFDRWTLRSVMQQLNHRLTRWVMKTRKRYKYSYNRARQWLRKEYGKHPKLFVHWQWGFRP